MVSGATFDNFVIYFFLCFKLSFCNSFASLVVLAV